jgi:Ca-activated chloride channel family protein
MHRKFSRVTLQFILSMICVAVLLPAIGSAQGLLVDVSPDHSVRLPRPIIIWRPHPHPRPIPRPTPPPASYKIKELSVQAKISDQVAKVQVSQSFVNTGSRQMEVCFVFPLPYDGAVDRLTLLVDGKEYDAKLLDAKAARKMYEDIVRKNKDPALLEWLGSGMFKTSVFPVPPGAERKVTLRYSQLCRKNQGLTEFLFPLSTAKYTSHAVEKVTFQVAIESSAKIKNVYSPTHAIETKRPDNRHAVIKFTATNEVPTSDFRLFYDIGKKQVGATVMSYRPDGDDDGYYLLLASPEIKAADAEPSKKTVVFVVDRSGSMSGKKIEQAKGALQFVLNNLHEGDLFNIVAYDSEVESFRPELQKYDDKTRQAALGFVEGVYAGGSTNIAGALKSALSQLKDSSRPNFVIFLTDGLPTVGETNESKIVVASKSENEVRARVFAFGVGYDVNSRLLDRLARTNFGQSEYVRPDEDIEASVGRLYNRIGAPVMTDVAIKFDVENHKPERGPVVNRVYPRDVYDLFAGEQLVQVGRYKQPGDAKVVVTGSVGGERQKLDFPAKLTKNSGDETNAFIEKIWAMRRVGEIIDEIDLKGKNDELVKELVALATRHGILTPYTSFLADENSNHRDIARTTEAASERLGALDRADGISGFAQRRAKGELQRSAQAPAASGPGNAAGGGAFYYSETEGKKVAVNTVRNVGSKTFFLREGRWVDSTATAVQEKSPIRVERYSDDYFELVSKYGKTAAQYLAINEPVIVVLGDKAYSF